ncbi:restriction alleviation protein, Lar family [Citrobacter portucalensis]|uniref:Lar family restriction alleviation protein n=1 Tax=Citrobacter portucalensis TaxID=1639133 RepID=UPI00157FEB9B|nr:Lar family restriction alleviation protein [Citrobacter portucalensis]NUH55867.1 restriction alleviation protein, Lar family [Citrobacter portucalensis]
MTTNNHPAHGPVSLDRLHQISEILSKAAAQIDGGNLGYAMADAMKVIDGAIAVFGAEPVPFDALRDAVAEVSGGPVMEWSDIYKGHQAVPFINFNSLARIVDKFRTSQPAPVMPDSENGLMPCPFCGGKARQLTIEQDNDPHFGGDVITCTECGASSHVEFGFKENLKSAWNSRAAMLQAGNSPVIQDGWVACSERMPENDDMVNIVIKHVDGSHYVFTGQWWGSYWNTDSDCIDNENVTHWMPLPAAPQQEV